MRRDCTILICHYNRLDQLAACVAQLRQVLGPEIEIVVSDDCSPPHVVEEMVRMPGVRFVLGERNRGLGHNSNKGLRAITTPYVLHLQDDHHLKPGVSADFLWRGIEALERFPQVGILRYMVPPYFRIGAQTRVGDTEMVRLEGSVWRDGMTAFYLYSDWAHLKRASLHQDLGYYPEGHTVGITELEFAFRVLKRGVGVYMFPEYRDIFSHSHHGRSFQAMPHAAFWKGTIRKRLSSAKALAAYAWYSWTGAFPCRLYE